MQVSVENIQVYPTATVAVIEEIRSERIAFILKDTEGTNLNPAGAMLGTMPDASLPITEAKLQAGIYAALPQAEEVPE